MDSTEMLRLFEAHREAEAARDIDAILETFVTDCFLETMPLGLRSDGRDAVRAAYEQQFFTAFPDLTPGCERQRPHAEEGSQLFKPRPGCGLREQTTSGLCVLRLGR
jgi:ketosteroid isomerase-like protein